MTVFGQRFAEICHQISWCGFLAHLAIWGRKTNDIQGRRPISTKLSHMLGSECDVRNLVRNLGHLTRQIWAPKQENTGPDFGHPPDFKANNFGMEQEIVNRKCVLKTITVYTAVTYIILYTLVH